MTMRIGIRQKEILKLVYWNTTDKNIIYDKVFKNPGRDGNSRSRIAKSLTRLRRHGLIAYNRSKNAKIYLTPKGAEYCEARLLDQKK